MTEQDGKAYAVDLRRAVRAWNDFVTARLPKGRGEIRSGSDRSKKATVEDIDVLDAGPGGQHDIRLVALDISGRILASHRINVLSPMVEIHAEIEEKYADGKLSDAERNRREYQLWRETVTLAVQKFVAGPLGVGREAL